MHFTSAILRETRSLRGAFSVISRAFDDVDKAIEAGDMPKARLLLRRIQIALESIEGDQKPTWRVDQSRLSRVGGYR
jgi:hypothetical protein